MKKIKKVSGTAEEMGLGSKEFAEKKPTAYDKIQQWKADKQEQVKRKLTLDPWQEEFVNYKGDIALCSPRQHGKSLAAGAKASQFAIDNPGKQVMIVSITEEQAKELLSKVMGYLTTYYIKEIMKGKEQTNTSKVTLKNGSVILVKAIGAKGFSILGYTNDMVIVDEAARVPQQLWENITPTILSTGGSLVLLSTPHGRRGYFYQAFNDPALKFKTIRVKLGDIENRPLTDTWTEMRRDKMKERIESERQRMTKREFAQQYLAEFVNDLDQFYEDAEIKKTLIQSKIEFDIADKDFCIGVDIGRMGGDATVYVIYEKKGDLLIQRDEIVWKEAKLDEIAYKIISLDQMYHFKRIYLDNGGIGIGVYDMLVGTPGFGKKRVIGVNNSEVVVEYNLDGTKEKKWMKEQLYTNLKILMQQGKILMFDTSENWQSLKGAQYEYTNMEGGARMRIFHSDHKESHFTEAHIRAAIFAREKINKFQISYM